MKDTVIVITGGHGGIGKVVASNFLKQGAKVVVLDKDDTTSKTILENKGYRVFTPEFDVKSPNECVMFSIHKVKMDSSDIIYFLLKPLTDISHQAGTGMQKEIQYAIRQEKNIRFITPEEIDFLSSKENTDIVCNQN